jgi:hypothetical protein
LKKLKLWQRFNLLNFWNKTGFLGNVVTIFGLPLMIIGYLTFFNGNEVEKVENIYVVILPVTENTKIISEKVYSPEAIIKSVQLDSIDQTTSSSERILARSVNGFYYSNKSDNAVLFSGITPFRLEKVGATFGADYRLIGIVTDFNELTETVRIDIEVISMTDNYGNSFEIRSKNDGFIGYAESLDSVSQQTVKVSKTENGFLFDHSEDVHIVLSYDKEDIELVGRVKS